MKVSCVILNYNDSETALALAERLLPYESLHQIVLVDNASTDGSGERLAAFAAQTEKAVFLAAPCNGGYGAGNNLGVSWAVREGGADYVLIANPDVEVSQSCIRNMARALEKRPEAAAVTAVMEDETYGAWRNAWPLRGFVRELLAMGPVSRRVFRPFLEYPESRFRGKKAAWVDAVHGSCLMVDGAKFLECGGYDEGMFLYQEEAVLAWRMRTGGYRTILLLNASYRHHHSVSISHSFAGELERQRLRETSVLYYMKHYLFINQLQERIARLWFWGIRMEIRAAGALRLLGERSRK